MKSLSIPARGGALLLLSIQLYEIGSSVPIDKSLGEPVIPRNRDLPALKAIIPIWFPPLICPQPIEIVSGVGKSHQQWLAIASPENDWWAGFTPNFPEPWIVTVHTHGAETIIARER
ncbi:hypothetical protein ACIGHN_05885 [Acidovorax sp. NPDC077693]|uniref:hypothetical protein n=1 Tax=unclassified Acidovorax TaxID=2684926 RepID=UPI0037C85CD2